MDDATLVGPRPRRHGEGPRIDAQFLTGSSSDGFFVLIRNCGSIGALVPVFETRADGPYAWLNSGSWLSSDPQIAPGAVNLTIYESR